MQLSLIPPSKVCCLRVPGMFSEYLRIFRKRQGTFFLLEEIVISNRLSKICDKNNVLFRFHFLYRRLLCRKIKHRKTKTFIKKTSQHFKILSPTDIDNLLKTITPIEKSTGANRVSLHFLHTCAKFQQPGGNNKKIVPYRTVRSPLSKPNWRTCFWTNSDAEYLLSRCFLLLTLLTYANKYIIEFLF